MNNKNWNNKRGLTVGSLLVIIGLVTTLVVGLILFKVETIKGNELGVMETWGEGVKTEPLTPKTYFWLWGIDKSIYTYEMGIQSYVMNDKDDDSEEAEGRKKDAYVVQSKDQQDMRISLRVQWRRLPNTVVELHKYARDKVEERVIRPTLLNIVKNQTTTRTALEVYSGEGLVKVQSDILAALQSSPELNRYIHVDNFVIEHIGLDPKYTGEIVARQVAVQERLKNIEQTKAAESAADKAKALAQADYEKVLVEARRDKEKGILESEKSAQQKVLAAEADAKQVALTAEAEKKRNVLIAEGEKEAALNRAQAILELGKADAEAKKLALSAYAVPGADSFVKIEVAKSMAEAFKNIKGYLPSDMKINLLTDQYNKGVSVLVGSEAK
jgi:regulator of protease activity HflC (stomatin/prohibitin superfamily)